MNLPMTDQPNRRARQLVTDLEQIQQDLSQKDFCWLNVVDLTDYKVFHMVNETDGRATISVTCSPNLVSVAFWDTRNGYMFKTKTRNPLTVMIAEEPICPEDWEQNLFSHSNNGPEQEGYYWDWTGYSMALTELIEEWFRGDKLSTDLIAINALRSSIREVKKIIGVAPSLADVVSLNNSWRNKWHPLPELVPVDDYLIWHRPFLRALAVIHQLSTIVQNNMSEQS
jgi:hypothetical protein